MRTILKAISLSVIIIFSISLFQILAVNHNEQHDEIHNLIWLLPTSIVEYQDELSNPQTMINRIAYSNIDCIAVYGGFWKSDGSISYDEGASFGIWTDFIKAMKDWNPKLKILVWITGWNDTCDFRDSSIRKTMCDSARQLLTAVPFDGWNEDYEGGSIYGVSYLLSFYRELSVEIKSLGKIVTVATEVDWGGYDINQVYPYLEGFDYITPMFYGRIAEESATTYWNNVLSNSSVPVLMGLAVHPEESGGTLLSQQILWIDNQSKSNLAGFSLWCYDYLTDADIAAWENWRTKDVIS